MCARVCVWKSEYRHPPPIPPPKGETPGKDARGEAELTDGRRYDTKQKMGIRRREGGKKEGWSMKRGSESSRRTAVACQ